MQVQALTESPCIHPSPKFENKEKESAIAQTHMSDGAREEGPLDFLSAQTSEFRAAGAVSLINKARSIVRRSNFVCAFPEATVGVCGGTFEKGAIIAWCSKRYCVSARSNLRGL